jgi:Co/Zn/Cd efflux system component
MSGCCCNPPVVQAIVPARVRRLLWIALAINAAMFLTEVIAGWAAHSVALLADALDFFGDAGNYGLSLAALALGARRSAQVALVKGITMAGFGAFVLSAAGWRALSGAAPEPATMGLVGMLALAANLGVALMLYPLRAGPAHLRAAWLCSRNDTLGNVAVLLAAAGVFGTGSAWPDLVVAATIAVLALNASAIVLRQALDELRRAALAPGRRRSPVGCTSQQR